MNKVIYVKSDKEYSKLKKKGLVIVDFNTTWCGPCKSYKPVFEELAKEHPGIKFLSVDAEEIEHDDCEDIRSVPTFKIFLNGELKRSFSGIDQDRLIKYIQRYGVQIYYKDELVRKFTPEMVEKVKRYIDSLGIRIDINGEKCKYYNKDIISKILEYIDVFSYNEEDWFDNE